MKKQVAYWQIINTQDMKSDVWVAKTMFAIVILIMFMAVIMMTMVLTAQTSTGTKLCLFTRRQSFLFEITNASHGNFTFWFESRTAVSFTTAIVIQNAYRFTFSWCPCCRKRLLLKLSNNDLLSYSVECCVKPRATKNPTTCAMQNGDTEWAFCISLSCKTYTAFTKVIWSLSNGIRNDMCNKIPKYSYCFVCKRKITPTFYKKLNLKYIEIYANVTFLNGKY